MRDLTEANPKPEISTSIPQNSGGENFASSRPIAEIKTGQRHRHDHGDIDGLAENIAEIGLLHPIVIRPDGRLIAGARRLRAFKRLKRDNLEKVVLGEYSENTFRKSFTPSEMVEIADDIEPLQMLEAKKRQLAGRGEDGRRETLQEIPPRFHGRLRRWTGSPG